MIYVLIRHMMIQHLHYVLISPDIFCCTKVYQTVSVGTLIIAVPLVLTVNNGLWGWGREAESAKPSAGLSVDQISLAF